MKLLKISSKKKSTKSGRNGKDATLSTDDAVCEPEATKKREPSSPKVKRKKFGLFSKSKSKEQKGATISTPSRTANNEEAASTPDTVPENDAYNLDMYNLLSVVPVEDAAVQGETTPASPQAPTETEDKLHEARSLLAQLNTATTQAAHDGEGEEGTELILPMPTYEISDQVSKEKADDQADETNEINPDRGNETIDNNRITIVDQIEEDVVENEAGVGKPTETNSTGDAKYADESAMESFETDETDGKNLSVETDDDRNISMVTKDEEDHVAGDPEEAERFQHGSVAGAAVRIWATAFGCGGVETLENCSALPIILQSGFVKKGSIRAPPVDLNKMFDERTGSDFLHHMLNVGYTLIYHIAVEEDSWVGRTVQLAFRPGACSAESIVQPAIEWNTMAGGKSSFVESKSIGLLDIDAIAASSLKEEGRDGKVLSPSIERSSLPLPAKPPTNPKNDTRVGLCSSRRFEGLNLGKDEFDCFFTITTQDGEIHLFEALDVEDCRRIVAGIRFNAHQLSRFLIEGDSQALMSDFYDNSQVPKDSVLSNEMILNRLSNAFFDE
mmetsp:Transcript_25956/g.60913  ORF Transcript_25956/g.60913 Transcript_25956/m.60913 type:complete len:558 (-) Transcript_25956:701-2374(-)|eukprot:CAMPEP_0197196096 /NCGR_PEP_ID=MMETSP1423-20130617/32170_1 /TAXON_ID=476441 /ORGANISM="Pseudo-nitzschia heimii, Strain UNC1101" /LENGTH=557 /DNA_ID=CAMNT_0042649867 /DNA_START=228 /DNA_END=1901 /DNA_ORIENTATION=+